METTPLHLSGPLALVDDNEDDLALMQHLLKKSGLASGARAFHGGDEVIEMLQRAAAGEPRIAAFCIDVKMPGMTGTELLAWIRGQPAYDDVPVVMCSTSEDPRDLDNAARHGAQAYVAKYPKPEAMREILLELERYRRGGDARKRFEVGCNLLSGPEERRDTAEPG